MTRVVFVLPSLGTGGAERQVVDLLNALDPARFEATLFVFGEAMDLLPYVDRQRVRVVVEPRRHKLDLRPAFRLARLIRDEQVDVIHCTLQISLFVAFAAVGIARRKVRVVDAVHTTVARSRKLRVADDLLYVPLMRRCEAVVAVCHAQREYWEGMYPSLRGRMTTIHNGIRLARFVDDVPAEEKAGIRERLGIDPADCVIGMVAALRPEKNHAGVLEAAALLARRGRTGVKFLLVGAAPPGLEILEARLRGYTADHGLGSTVIWAGKAADPRRLMSVFDAALLFSTTESFPLSILECLAMGKPVIAPRIGGLPEMVDDGETGLLVPPGDVHALAGAIERIASDHSLRSALSSRARQSVETRFSMEAMVAATEIVLEGGAQ